MKVSSKATALLLSMALVLSSFSIASGQEVFVNIDEIQGLVDGKIPQGGTDLVIPVHFINPDQARSCISNGFAFTGDVTFDGIEGDWNPNYPWQPGIIIFPPPDPWIEPFFDAGIFINYFDSNLDGVNDGVGFAGIANSGSGLPEDFDDWAYSITLSGVSGVAGEILTMDSSFWGPANIWLWCGDPSIYPDWGGPYEWMVGYEPYISTWCTPQPTILHESDPLLEVHIRFYNWDDIVLESIFIQGKIPAYEGYPIIEDGIITTACRVTRFLGASGFRPIPPEGVQSTYKVEFDMTDGTHHIMTGDYVLQVSQGDVNLDGVADLADVQSMIDYFWSKGQSCQYEEFMDVDGNGQLDIRDAVKLVEISGI